MNIGVQQIFQSFGYEGVDDAAVIEEELRLAELADALGFDAVWPVEHHFTDYSFCPDNTVYLAHLASRTQRIALGTGAVILPWNDPLRVAEKISLLDHLCAGRLLFGMGRGLARREYAGMRVDMNESRERFDEAAAMILEALESGEIRGEGPFYPQPPTKIRPRPARSFRGRTYSVAMSPDSLVSAAHIGARMVVFSQKPWEEQAEGFAEYRRLYAAEHEGPLPPPMVCDFVYCDTDASRAEALGRKHIAGYLQSVMQHYELADDHFKRAKGYESYGNSVDLLKAIGLEQMCEIYLSVQAWGTPDQILSRLEERARIAGSFDLTCCFRFAGLPYERVEQSMRTFAAEVMPALRKMAAGDASSDQRPSAMMLETV